MKNRRSRQVRRERWEDHLNHIARWRAPTVKRLRTVLSFEEDDDSFEEAFELEADDIAFPDTVRDPTPRGS